MSMNPTRYATNFLSRLQSGDSKGGPGEMEFTADLAAPTNWTGASQDDQVFSVLKKGVAGEILTSEGGVGVRRAAPDYIGASIEVENASENDEVKVSWAYYIPEIDETRYIGPASFNREGGTTLGYSETQLIGPLLTPIEFMAPVISGVASGTTVKISVFKQ